MSRLEASQTVKREIKKRFNFECAACGRPASDLNTDVAHLFEDATARSPQASRLIVLHSNCNQAEARANHHSKPPLAELFDAAEVSVRARRSYREGRYPCAYQGHRLAAYFWETSAQYSKAVESLVEAISSARPIRWGDFLSATVLEVERLCLSYMVGIIQRWLFLDRLALTLYDYRRWDESAWVQYAAAKLRDRIKEEPRDPNQLWFDRTNSFRREALIQAFTGKMGSGTSALNRNVNMLIEDAREFERQCYFDAFATNLDVAGKITLEIGNDAEKAHAYTEEALERSIKVTNNWVLQEHYWRDAQYYHAKNDRQRTMRSVIKAFHLFRSHPVVLEPTLVASGPTPHNPIEELQQYGITEDELREYDAAPSGNPPAELTLELSKSAVRRVVNNCMK